MSGETAAAPAADTAPATVGTSSDEGVSEKTTMAGGSQGGQDPNKETTPAPAETTPAATNDLSSEGDTGEGIPAATDPDAPKDILDDVDKEPDGIDWINDLPEAYRDKASFNKYKSMEDFLKGHENLSSMINQRTLMRPGEDATAEEMAAWNEHIGIPTTVDQYQVPQTVQEMEQEVKDLFFGKEGFEPLLARFHEANMSQKQIDQTVPIFQDIMQKMGSRQLALEESNASKQYEETVSQLKKEWGTNFKPNISEYKKTLENMGLGEWARARGVNNDAQFIKAIQAYGHGNFSESSITGTTGSGHAQSFQDQVGSLEKDLSSRKISKAQYNEKRADLYRRRNEATGRQ